jgi:hypothetical protein
MACSSRRARCRCGQASGWLSSYCASPIPTGGTLPGLRGSAWKRTWRFRNRDSPNGATPSRQRTIVEARRGLVGRPRPLSPTGADGASAGDRLAKRHADQGSPFGSRHSPDHELGPSESCWNGCRLSDSERSCRRLGRSGISDARDPEGRPPDTHSSSHEQRARRSRVGHRRGAWTSRASWQGRQGLSRRSCPTPSWRTSRVASLRRTWIAGLRRGAAARATSPDVHRVHHELGRSRRRM